MENKKIHEEVRAQITAAIIGALGLVVGLAWNDAVKSLIESIYPGGGGVISKFIYAAILTIVVTTIIILLTRWFGKKEEEAK